MDLGIFLFSWFKKNGGISRKGLAGLALDNSKGSSLWNTTYFMHGVFGKDKKQ